MSKETALDRYSGAVVAVKQHIQDNKVVFDAHQNLVNKLIDAENDLRDQVAESGEGVSNGDHKVTLTKQTQTWADIETLDRLVSESKISPEVRAEIVKTQDRPPKITIIEQK